MTVPHCIRLQGPWQVVPPGADPHAEPIEVRIPATWEELFGNLAGTALFRRAFNTPTNLTAEDRILIRLPEKAGHIEGCSLNGVILTPLESPSPAYDVTQHFSDFNRLEIQIHFDPATPSSDIGGLHQAVILEIHANDAPAK